MFQPSNFLKISRRIYKIIFKPIAIPIDKYIFDDVELKYQAASDYIKLRLLDNQPLMISRLGIETQVLLNYKEVNLSSWQKKLKYIRSEINNYDWNESTINLFKNNAGFFPSSIQMIEKFSEMVINDLKYVDIWGQFYSAEQYFKNELKNAKRIRIFDIEPFIHKNPWSEALNNKTVLIIHPFEKSIISQYQKREKLFVDSRVLPNFNLKTIKAIQSIAGNNCGFHNWFDALDYMKDKIDRIDFDIAIIGCGSYGLPLAAHIKRLNKKAIHIGGATQLLFGIIGARWENHKDYSHFINEHWVRPLKEEIPGNYFSIENGCYW